MRAKVLCCRFLIITLLVSVGLCDPRLASAQWSNDPTVNTPVSRSSAQEWNPLIVSDGANGAIIVWKYYVGSGFGFDIAGQRLDANGSLQWSTGVDICSALRDQGNYSMIPDGSGGAIITWDDERSPTPFDSDIYAQRVDASGNIKWQTDGIAICKTSEIQANPKIVSDGSGGAIITWRDSRNYPSTGVDIYAQRVNASGTVQWTANGVPVCSAGGDQLYPEIVSDGSGGAVIAWTDRRDIGTLGEDVYAQRVNASGLTQWTANGVGFKANGNQSFLKIASDGSGGAFITWQDDYFGTTDLDIGALRIDSNGSFPWTPTSVWIAQASGNQTHVQVVNDGSDGAIFTWRDYRNGTSNPDIYAMRINSSKVGLWPGSSGLICNASGRQEAPRLISDDFGGAIITWHDYRNGDTDVYAQRVDGAGAPQWKSNGVEICTAPKPQNSPAIVKAGTCGAIITWIDQRWVGDPFNDTDWDIYAQRVYCDGKLAQQSITLDVPNGGESWQAGTPHIIVWHGQGIDNYDVKIEYSTDNGATYNFITYKTNTGTSGSYTWDVPNTPSTQCLVRVSVNFPPEISDVSDAPFTITSSGGNNTQPGSNVQVDLGTGVKVTFDNVTTAGNTSLNTKTSGPPPPGGFSIVPSGSPVYYSITTTASHTGNIKVCIQYNDAGMTPAQEAALKLQVYESPPGTWKDITSSLDVNANIICGIVSHLSDFAVMTPTGGTVTQTVSLPQGWSWISFNVQPPDLSIDKVMAGVTHLKIVVNNAGQFYIPNVINSIGQINILEGYKVYVDAADQVSITGQSVNANTPISLVPGWNFVAYLPGTPMSAESALASCIPNLAIVKNAGGGFFIPNVINSLGNMKPGEGYKLYMNAAATLTYP